MIEYYDRQGKPMDQAAWAGVFGNEHAKRVASTDVGEAHISTVWLGLDHAMGDGPPVIFETMVFRGPLDEEMWRYHTEEEALKGHEDVVEKVKAAK